MGSETPYMSLSAAHQHLGTARPQLCALAPEYSQAEPQGSLDQPCFFERAVGHHAVQPDLPQQTYHGSNAPTHSRPQPQQPLCAGTAWHSLIGVPPPPPPTFPTDTLPPQADLFSPHQVSELGWPLTW